MVLCLLETKWKLWFYQIQSSFCALSVSAGFVLHVFQVSFNALPLTVCPSLINRPPTPEALVLRPLCPLSAGGLFIDNPFYQPRTIAPFIIHLGPQDLFSDF